MDGNTSMTINEPAVNGGRTLFRLAVAVPFFLGAALYLSVIFAAFAALPLIYAHLRFGRLAGILCSLSNIGLVFVVSGRIHAAVFFVTAVVLAAAIAECVKLKLRIEWNVVFSVGVMLVVSALLLLSYSHKYNINPVQRLDAFVGEVVSQVANNVEKYKASSAISTQDLDKFVVDPEMTKRNILTDLPSFITIFLMVMTVSNVLLMLRLNLQNVRETLCVDSDYFKHWKAPDHMVWPTLAAAFCLVIEIPMLSDVALNVFKVLMAVYALQGLAITNYLFDLWGVKGFLRPLGYLLAVVLLTPLVISLGFFDLWFDFREKFKT